jgi:hypothetical protein
MLYLNLFELEELRGLNFIAVVYKERHLCRKENWAKASCEM